MAIVNTFILHFTSGYSIDGAPQVKNCMSQIRIMASARLCKTEDCLVTKSVICFPWGKHKAPCSQNVHPT